jgi:hypothetical protein
LEEKVNCLSSWNRRPNGVRGVFSHCGEIPESLAVIKPGLLYLQIRVRIIEGGVPIGLFEKGVPLGAEFLEGLGRYIFIPFFS